jgi:hypothetical protein
MLERAEGLRLGNELLRRGLRIFLWEAAMIAFLLWCVLFVVCWPVALLALVMYPIVWLFLLPFRLVGIAVHGVLALVWALVMLPARLLSTPFRA